MATEYEGFQRKVASKNRALRPPSTPKSHDELCFPKTRTVQPHQRFVERFLGPGSTHTGLLLYHRPGAGKTCAAVRVAEAWRAAGRRVIVLLPAALAANFRAEMRGLCAGPSGVAAGGTEYEILSFHQFVKIARGVASGQGSKGQGSKGQGSKDKKARFDLRNALLIVDEVQNIVSLRGIFYRTLLEVVSAAPPDLRVLLMSATPIGDRPSDIALTLNLLRPKEPLPVGRAFDAEFVETKRAYEREGEVHREAVQMDRFAELTRGLVSYYEASEAAFPRTRHRVVRCPMSAFQWRSYTVHERGLARASVFQDLLHLPKDFLLGLRQISNIAFPGRLTGDEGLTSLADLPDKALGDVSEFSCKMERLLRSVDAARGPVFVYSHFLRDVGIACLVRLLEHRGYGPLGLADTDGHQHALRSYAVWSGDETPTQRAAALEAFNRPENRDGSVLKVILGSPAMKEGVSLLRAREVHILEPYWNDARIEQIAGRAARFCSHRDLKASQRRVDVYVYAAVPPEGTVDAQGERVVSVDERILAMADSKSRLAREFLDVLRDGAVDRELFFPKA